MSAIEKSIESKLEERENSGNYRILKPENGLIDFCSNDYLGFAQSSILKASIDGEINSISIILNGSTGSRLLTGNSAYIEELEKQIAAIHHCEAGLIFNSGYDANLGLFSSLPQRGDTIITDELIHASIIDGGRLSYANKYTFKHNDLNSLEDKLKQARGNCYVVVESIYSMDGDASPLADILNITEKYKAALIVDEAHAVGVYKYGLIDQTLNNRIFARIVTFGKAMGCHGAIVLGSDLLRNYLINFARSFIYTTAPPMHHFASIKMAYKHLADADKEILALRNKISLFKRKVVSNSEHPLISSDSAIQCIVLKSNGKAKALALNLQSSGFDVRPILSPTVPTGSERVRICLHSFNTENDIILLTENINKFINA
ncbi:8-amino-7-oxononanoate synthase [Mucilaginibacter frigoritolerans]|uniref:8-amino-7-oxononanoate synthase n=1 Tax=Mucilaginibacter frigoritolerans TaxID=652788 RepID=A0A562TZA1_9SPHI|nr:8-amino-7-oxononanoate synthase [Mucilaginibacter frigoritolerans]TWI98140.1 8-amino-7-oxononanoate synthase [Mucilaginibacter frigoritolerans]